ncbi:MAG: glycosyltransferase family 52 protein [Methanobacteriaceae archaeon]|nr:glycosyltransferase family 52 protein [Methanobacteriaceae archaeon]
MSNQLKRICAVDTVYSLFLYFLICEYNEEDIFIFSGGIPLEIRKNINHIYFPNLKFIEGYKLYKTNTIKGILKNIFGYLKYVLNIFRLRILLSLKTLNKEVNVYGHGHVTFSYIFYEYENSFIIEDGIANYYGLKKTPKLNKILEKILHFLGIYIFSLKEGFGTHKNIKKVFLTKEYVPKEIKNKVIIIDIKKLWNKKTGKEKEKILSNMNFDKNILTSLKSKKIILLTSPYSEENLLDFNTEITIYKNLLKKYNPQDVFIKKHPRETKNYKEIFPEIEVIENSFPVELLEIFEIKIEKILTISSSAALNFKNCEIELYEGKTPSKKVNKSIKLLKEKIIKNR